MLIPMQQVLTIGVEVYRKQDRQWEKIIAFPDHVEYADG